MPRAPSPPRRSSRAKPPTPSLPPPSQASSSTSSVSARERSTRSVGKQEKSVTPQSRDSEEVPTVVIADPPPTRRSGRRAQEDSRKDDMPHNENGEIVEDEETTRCICGFQEYPGPPAIDTPTPHRASKAGLPTTEQDTTADEPGSLFIQCDTCEVWQHGGCVGIMTESATPENYFCEQCRPDFHRLSKTASGQKYSRYLPVVSKPPPKSHQRKQSVSKDWNVKTAKETERSLRAAAAIESTTRRSTMNSRAAYDEDEVLRKVLEESKVEGQTNPSEGSASRKGKRGREESEEMRSDVKRQRTNSNGASPSPSNVLSNAENSEGDDSKKKQAPRGAAARSHREKEAKEKERERSEAANKRKGRAERRRADDPDLPEESAETPNVNTADETPTPLPIDTTSSTTILSHSKRGNRGGGKRGRGGGRGGFGRNEDVGSPASGLRNGKEPSASPGVGSGADSSGTGAALMPTRRGRPGHNGTNGTVREPTMAELKKRANIMLDILAQSKLEMARSESRGLVSKVNVEATPQAAFLAGELANKLEKWQHEYTLDGATMTEAGSAKG